MRASACSRHRHAAGLLSAAEWAINRCSRRRCLRPRARPSQEAACWCLGYIAGHTSELAQQSLDAGAAPLLVLCVQEPESEVKRVAASALSDIAKHTPELAQSVVDAGAVAYLAPLVVSQDAKLKRQVRNACGLCGAGARRAQQQTSS